MHAKKTTLVERLYALYEYDREPVTAEKLHGGKTFIAMFAGEQVAGTEFILGTLLVAHGVSASDALFGLLVGNVLAVQSWACARPSECESASRSTGKYARSPAPTLL